MVKISGSNLRRRRIFVLTALVAFVAVSWMLHSPVREDKRRVPVPNGKASRGDDPSLVLVTGYCNCGKCCGWKRSWFGLGAPVYSYGSMKGKPKRVGVTASGTLARRGTVAADPKVFKPGSRLSIPGYGTGLVEDVGGSIKGRHIDVWFASHEEALEWGARWLKVELEQEGG